MLSVYPDYYSEFQCIASRCEHTCCAGWEIDIDPESLARYRRTEGNMGKRLQDAISEGEEPHFILEEEERCPFLNEKNLCDLILFGGEDFLCQICTDHPRFRSFLPGRTEIGLGLCCEAAGALILGWKRQVTLRTEGEEGSQDAEEAALVSLRDKVISLGQERGIPLTERMENILCLCRSGVTTEPMEWISFFRGLERLEESWTAVLDELEGVYPMVDREAFAIHMKDREAEYEQLLVYFLYRHFLSAYDDGDVSGKAAFAVLSVKMLMALGMVHYHLHGEFTFADQVEYARRYSSEIEYSQENLDALFDALAGGF